MERRLRMYEARENILSKVGSTATSVIDLDHFLQGTVTEVGKMMGVDRCDVMSIAPSGELLITHEYLAESGDGLPASSLGLRIPMDAGNLRRFDLVNPLVVDDTSSSLVLDVVRSVAQMIGTKSVMLVPVEFKEELMGIVGLHFCHHTHHWMDDEINFMRSLARQIAIGYRYTRLYSEKENEAHINKVLLDIANDINTGSDFSEVAARILDRAIDLLHIQAACIAILDANDNEIHFSNLRTAQGVSDEVLKLKSLKIPSRQMLPSSVVRGQMIRMLSPDQNEMSRFFLTQVVSSGAAVITPIVIEDKIFGALVLLWAEPHSAFSPEEISLTLGITDQIGIALSKARLSAEVLRLRRELEHARSVESGHVFVGKSDSIMRCMEMTLYVADSYTTVLLQGESGTGKELMADLIQARSPRASKPYVKINCAAIPETLLESELFGHEKGAFTDARQRRIGKFEEADDGTLFLDEVGEMSPAAQVKLLRVLQNGEFTRVGSNEVIKADVRVIAATNMDLDQAVRDGRFRTDLFYRLNVYPIMLPPLRERRDDIPLLAMHFLGTYKKRSKKNITGLTEKALSTLRKYDWPGNVRELENAIERAVIISQGRMITLDDLPDAVRGVECETGAPKTFALEVGTSIDEVERRIILETLAHTRGDKSRTAQILGIGRKTLYRKLQQYEKG